MARENVSITGHADGNEIQAIATEYDRAMVKGNQL